MGTCTSEALSSVIAAGGLAPLLERLAHLDGGIPNFALTEFSEIHTALIWYQRADPLPSRGHGPVGSVLDGPLVSRLVRFGAEALLLHAVAWAGRHVLEAVDRRGNRRLDPLLGLRINVGVFALYVLTQYHDQGPVIARLHAYSARAAQHVRLGCRLLHLASSFLFILADGGGLLKAIVGAQASRARARPTGS